MKVKLTCAYTNKIPWDNKEFDDIKVVTVSTKLDNKDISVHLGENISGIKDVVASVIINNEAYYFYKNGKSFKQKL